MPQKGSDIGNAVETSVAEVSANAKQDDCVQRRVGQADACDSKQACYKVLLRCVPTLRFAYLIL